MTADRAAYRATLALAALICLSLVAAPVWDFWHHRHYRLSGGTESTFGLILSPTPSAARSPRPPRHAAPPVAEPAAAEPAGAAAPGPHAPRTDSAPPAAGPPAVAPDRPAARPALAGFAAPARVTPPQRPASPAAARAAAPRPDKPAVAAPAAEDAGAAAPAPAAPAPAGPPPVNIVWSGGGNAPQAPAPAVPAGSAKDAPAPGAPQDAGPDPADPAPQDADGGGSPRLSLVPARPAVAAGDILRVQVVLTGGRDVSSVPLHVRFDPGVLEFLGAKEGAAFQSSSLQPILLAGVNPNRPGDVAVGLSLVESAGRFNGSGTLIVLEFRALQAGRSDLTLDRASVRGRTGQPLPVQFENTGVLVR